MSTTIQHKLGLQRSKRKGLYLLQQRAQLSKDNRVKHVFHRKRPLQCNRIAQLRSFANRPLVQSSFPWMILFDFKRDIFHNTPWLVTHMIHESFSSHIERASFSAQQVDTVLWGWCHCTGKKSEKSQQCNRWLLVKCFLSRFNFQFVCSHQSPNDFKQPSHSKKILLAWVG